MSYVDGFLLPLPTGKEEEYRKMAQSAGEMWMKHGALAYVETVGDDLTPEPPKDGPAFNPRRFADAAGLKAGETAVFAFIVYRDRAHRDEVNAKVMADPAMKDGCSGKDMPFDPNRMCYGGFRSVVALGMEK